jgi:hypothetical protein
MWNVTKQQFLTAAPPLDAWAIIDYTGQTNVVSNFGQVLAKTLAARGMHSSLYLRMSAHVQLGVKTLPPMFLQGNGAAGLPVSVPSSNGVLS